MKGYLLREQAFMAGDSAFIESSSSENNYAAAFEDDTETGYFYAYEIDKETGALKILDAVHVYQVDSIADKDKAGVIKIIWSTDWLKCALLINNYCHAVFDFANHGGYNRNEFPPPNEIWTKAERRLTDKMVADLFK